MLWRLLGLLLLLDGPGFARTNPIRAGNLIAPATGTGAGIPAAVTTPYLSESSALRALRGAHNARVVLEAGFTAVKDVGNDAEWAAVDVRRAIEKGWFPGPTLLTTGKIIAPFGGQSQ